MTCFSQLAPVAPLYAQVRADALPSNAVRREGLWAQGGGRLVGWEDPCGCLGHLLERRPEFERWADRVMLAVLAIMAGGSLWSLLLSRHNPFRTGWSKGGSKTILLLLIAAVGHAGGFAKNFATTSSADQGYEIRGVAEQLIYKPDGEKAFSKISDFHLIHLGNRWWLSFTSRPASDSDNQQYACDGTNCYYLIDVRNSKRRAIPEGQLTGHNDGAAIVIPGIIPRINPDSTAMILWFAYLSHTYLDMNKGNKVVPPDVFNINAYNASTAPPQRCQLVRLSHYPQLPQKAVFWEDGIFHAALMGSSYKPAPARRWPSPYDQGFTNLIYTVRAITNIESLALPLESEFLCYMPAIFEKDSFIPSRDELRLHKKVRLQTFFVAPRKQPISLMPSIPGLTYVQDKRFTNITARPVEYTISNHWLEENEVKLLPAFRDAVAFQTVPPRRNSQISSIFMIILICISLLPLGCLLWWRIKKIQDTRSTDIN